MGDSELSAARERIENVEKRLTALEEHGIDIAALRRQLAFARARLRNGGSSDAQTICDEIISTAKKLTDGTESWTRTDANRRVVTASYSAPQSTQVPPPSTAQVPAGSPNLAEQVQAILSGGLLQSMVQDQLQQLEKRMEQRIAEQIRLVRDQFARELAQVIAAKPWQADVRQVSAQASAMDGGTVELIQAQIADLRRELSARESWYSPEDVRLLINEMGAQIKVETKPFADGKVPSDQASELDMKSNWLTKLEDAAAPKVEPNAPTQQHKETPVPSNVEQMPSPETTRSRTNQTANTEITAGNSSPMMSAASNDHDVAVSPAGHQSAGSLSASHRKDAEFTRKLVQLMPDALKNPGVQKCVLALVALESMARPSALAELTGLRNFLRQEVKAATEKLKSDMAAVSIP